MTTPIRAFSPEGGIWGRKESQGMVWGVFMCVREWYMQFKIMIRVKFSLQEISIYIRKKYNHTCIIIIIQLVQ